MKFLKNIYVISVLTKINIVFFTFIGSILLNRFLGPTLKGEYSYIINYVSIISLILTFSITKALPFYMKQYGKEIEKQFINFIYFLTLLYVFVTLAIYYYFDSKTLLIILLFSIFSQFYQQISFIAMIKNLYWKSILNQIEVIVYTIILFITFFSDTNSNLDIIFLAYGFKIIFGISLYIFKFRIYPNKVGLNLVRFKEIMIFGFFPTVSALLITLNYKVDVIILEKYVSYYDLGLYSLGVTLAGMLWIIPDAFKDVLFNKTARNDSIKDIVFSIKFNIYISLVVFLGFLLFGNFFIKNIYGVDFAGAYSVVLILFLGNVPMIFFKMINTLYIAKGKQKIAMFILSIAVILNVISNFVLIPLFSIEGAALSSVISYMLCGMIFLRIFVKEYEIKLRDIFKLNVNELDRIKLGRRGKK
ncbi:polysaccharide biosynthesis C-terminal domain-containing protein [Pseudalkalibacillus sp. NRS-1564]|uniref:oligosaccharide flippase family protein n=1 Tax=Pseudalkalibacillus sp. NRS-1564 TaxID=3233900 RepID=UPI003D2DC34F